MDHQPGAPPVARRRPKLAKAWSMVSRSKSSASRLTRSAAGPARETLTHEKQRFVRPATSLYRQLWKRFPELPRLFLSFEKAHEEDRNLELTPDDIPHVPGLCAFDRSSRTAHAEAKHRKGAKRLAGSAAQREILASAEASETLVR